MLFAAGEVVAATGTGMATGGDGYERWKSALLSTLFISTLPNILLYLIPSKWLKRGKNDTLNIQHVLLCFAAGGLLGDVLLHSIPHLLSPHQHHEHDQEVLNTLHEEHDHDHHVEHENGHEHHDHHEESHASPRILQGEHHEDHEHHHEHLLHIGLLVIVGYMIFFISERLLSQQFSSDPEKKKNDDHHCHAHALASNISVMGWLNIFADVMHNFTDGIAMGASYASGSSSNALGLAATISILFHEIPHEIGDFTILIESGVRLNPPLLLSLHL
jgi:solute carrier family 39 (zinc transporter), member 7